MRDSNSRPHDYESGALPAELIQHSLRKLSYITTRVHFRQLFSFSLNMLRNRERGEARYWHFRSARQGAGLHNWQDHGSMKKSYWQFQQSFRQAAFSNSAKLSHFAVKLSKQKRRQVTYLRDFSVSITFWERKSVPLNSGIEQLGLGSGQRMIINGCKSGFLLLK